MAWVRVDDALADHPKLLDASWPPLALALQVAALCYCNRNLTDGFIPRAKATNLLPLGEGLAFVKGSTGQDASWEPVIADLLDIGLWREVEGGYEIHDYLDYQPSRADVQARLVDLHEKRAAAGKLGALARWGEAQVRNGKHDKAIANASQSDGPNPKPNPIKTKTTKVSGKPDPIPYVAIVERLNEKAGTAFRASSKSTRKQIKARFAEGFTADDFFAVIDSRAALWRPDPKMAEYLRPQTLFGTKFESYLQHRERPGREVEL